MSAGRAGEWDGEIRMTKKMGPKCTEYAGGKVGLFTFCYCILDTNVVKWP